jgi:glycosyltransferase involved in cell wall biosynthesis
LSRIKGQDRLLRAAALLARRSEIGPFRVVLAGGPVPNEPDYPAELEAIAAQLDPPPVTFTGPLARAALAPVIAQSAIAVNLSPPGLFDKAALETMLAGKPTLVTNPDFASLLGEAVDLLILPHGADDAALAERLAALLALGPERRAAIGRDLRGRVLAQHSLESLADRIVALMAEAAHGR